jgi:hypothetical protein
MSTRLALGAAGALAGLATLSGRGSRGWAPASRDPEEISRRARAFLDARSDDHVFRGNFLGDGGPRAERRAELELRRAAGRAILGVGGWRVVFTLPRDRVLKVAYWRGEQANRNEVSLWDLVSSDPRLADVARCLAPVLEHSGDGRWLVMARYDTGGGKDLSRRCHEVREAFGIEDHSDSNIGERTMEPEARIIDYGMLSEHKLREGLLGRGIALGPRAFRVER